jgi:hypothetical protein
MSQLVLKRASASRPSGQRSDKDYNVLANGKVVGRIYEPRGSPFGPPELRWGWSIITIVPGTPGVTNGYCRDARGGDGEVSGGVGEGQAGTSALLKGLLIHASYRGRHRKARQRLRPQIVGGRGNVATCIRHHTSAK